MVDVVALAAELTLVSVGHPGHGVFDMDAPQSIFSLQIIIVVHHDAFIHIVGHQRQQSFRIYGRGIRLVQMEPFHSLLKQQREDFVFFNEEHRLGHYNEFHRLLKFFRCKCIKKKPTHQCSSDKCDDFMKNPPFSPHEWAIHPARTIILCYFAIFFVILDAALKNYVYICTL